MDEDHDPARDVVGAPHALRTARLRAGRTATASLRWLLVAAVPLLGGCVTPGAVDQRVAHWRSFLAREAPVGTAATQAVDAMRRAGLDPRPGTYVTVRDNGERVSHCPDPRQALSARETSGVRGLYVRYDFEITVCLSAEGRVIGHHVSAWNAGV